LDRVLLRAQPDQPQRLHVATIFRAFLGFQASQYGEPSALAVTSLVPSIVLGMLVQRHLVRGLTLGAVQR
jgi:multiple sugar transport system permease protein